MKRKVYFVVDNIKNIIYVDEKSLGEEPKNISRFCDLIQDRYDLSSEFEWNAEKPTVEGLYRAAVKFIQTAEDDYKLVVLGYDNLMTLPEPKILN